MVLHFEKLSFLKHDCIVICKVFHLNFDGQVNNSIGMKERLKIVTPVDTAVGLPSPIFRPRPVLSSANDHVTLKLASDWSSPFF